MSDLEQSGLYSDLLKLNLSMIFASMSFNNTDMSAIDMIDGCELMNEMVVPSTLNQIISIFGTIICFVGIVGNIFSIIVLCKKSMKKLSTYSYLLGLSICDELSLILTVFIWLDYLLPYMSAHLSCQSRVKLINFHKISLYFIYPIVSATQALSVWITLAFTVDRYLYVCKPFYGVKYCTRHRASLIICLLYLLATIYSIPQFLERTYVKEEIYGIERYFIGYTDLGRNFYFNSIYHLFIYCFFVTFIPFLVIMFLNGFLVFEIIQSRQRFRKMSHASFRYTSDESKIRSDSNLTQTSCFSFKKKPTTEINQATNNEDQNSVELHTLHPTPNHHHHHHHMPKFSMTSQRSNFNFAAKSLRNDVTLMLVGLIVVFFICQVPSTILRLITFKNLSIFFKPLYQTTLDISNLLVVCNSTFNCILYVMLGKKFRAEFFKTFFPNLCKDKDATSFINTYKNQNIGKS